MIALIILGVVALIAIVATLRAVANDGYRPVRIDRTRLPADVPRPRPARKTRNVAAPAAHPHPASFEQQTPRPKDTACGMAASGVS